MTPNIELTLACQEILDPNVILEPILRNANNYKVIKGRIKFYIFLFKITIAAGTAFFSFRTLLEKSLIGGCQRPRNPHSVLCLYHNLCMVFHAFYKSILTYRYTY